MRRGVVRVPVRVLGRNLDVHMDLGSETVWTCDAMRLGSEGGTGFPFFLVFLLRCRQPAERVNNKPVKRLQNERVCVVNHFRCRRPLVLVRAVPRDSTVA